MSQYTRCSTPGAQAATTVNIRGKKIKKSQTNIISKPTVQLHTLQSFKVDVNAHMLHRGTAGARAIYAHMLLF